MGCHFYALVVQLVGDARLKIGSVSVRIRPWAPIYGAVMQLADIFHSK